MLWWLSSLLDSTLHYDGIRKTYFFLDYFIMCFYSSSLKSVGNSRGASEVVVVMFATRFADFYFYFYFFIL